jgi:hypothetical protein
MEKRPPYNPFEELNDFHDLNLLVNHILNSLKVEAVNVQMPPNFDKKLIYDPDAILPVPSLLEGNATFSYILHRSEHILEVVKKRIKEVNENSSLSIADKFQFFEEIRKNIVFQHKYFDTMNPIRYMSAFEWRIVYTEEQGGKLKDVEMKYPNTKLDLKIEHWNQLDYTFRIRGHLLKEIIFFIDVEIDRIKEELKNTKYTWEGASWEYDICEIVLSLIASKKVNIEKGSERSFIHDFMEFFGKSDNKFSYYKGKIMGRDNRPKFLLELQTSLQNCGKSSVPKSRV